MNKEQILTMAQDEGKEKDLPDLEAQKSGAWIAYTIGVILLLIVDIVNGVVLHYDNRGADFVLFSMICALFVTKYIRIRKLHELVVAILFGITALLMLVRWIMQLMGMA